MASHLWTSENIAPSRGVTFFPLLGEIGGRTRYVQIFVTFVGNITSVKPQLILYYIDNVVLQVFIKWW